MSINHLFWFANDRYCFKLNSKTNFSYISICYLLFGKNTICGCAVFNISIHYANYFSSCASQFYWSAVAFKNLPVAELTFHFSGFHLQIFWGHPGRCCPQCYSQWSKDQLDLQSCPQTQRASWSHICGKEVQGSPRKGTFAPQGTAFQEGNMEKEPNSFSPSLSVIARSCIWCFCFSADLVLSCRLFHWEIIMIVYYRLFSTSICCIGCSLILIQVYSLVRLDILDFIALDFCCWMIGLPSLTHLVYLAEGNSEYLLLRSIL